MYILGKGFSWTYSYSIDVAICQVYQGNVKFCTTFLEHLTTGLSLDHPQTSRKEFEVQLRTFRECLLYLVTSLDHEVPETRGFIEGAFEKVRAIVVRDAS